MFHLTIHYRNISNNQIIFLVHLYSHHYYFLLKYEYSYMINMNDDEDSMVLDD